MAKKKHYEYRESKHSNRDSDGLKQRRLKEESRWKFNPNQEYVSDDLFDKEEDWFQDLDGLDSRR